MSDFAIRCDRIAKQYRIGERERYRALRDTVTDVVTSPFRRVCTALRGGNDDPPDADPTIWALKDVCFEVKSGEVIGIIGRNGAGKSTLLKILSRITKPTLGSAEIYGRVGSLLEVGTGFHPELTGRENIYLNGAILGMSKAEIARKFDEMVAFAELERFIDTPVKRYSSGMYMRLAFAVAAHLDTEILLVDEVLAVGDVQFQKKCLSKMGAVSHQGRTVVFVSHNIGAVMQLCGKGILLENGAIKRTGPAIEVARAYLAGIADSSEVTPNAFEGPLTSDIQFEKVLIASGDHSDTRAVWPTEPVRVSVVGFCRRDIPNFRVTLSLFRDGIRLLTMHDVETPQTLPAGTFRVNYEIPARFLRPGEYSIAIGGYRAGVNEWLWAPNVAVFTVTEEWGEGYDPINIGLVNLPHYGTRIIGMSPAEETPIHA